MDLPGGGRGRWSEGVQSCSEGTRGDVDHPSIRGPNRVLALPSFLEVRSGCGDPVRGCWVSGSH